MKISSLLACSVLLGFLTSSCSYDPAAAALWESRSAVKQKLKSPGTADFDTCRIAARSDEKRLYLVYIAVDSQNGFGATVRNYALAVMASGESVDKPTAALHLEIQEGDISVARVKELTRELGNGWTLEPWVG